MGLDVVELILTIEEAFAIGIKDSEAADLRTVGDLYALVLSKKGRLRTDDCPISRTVYCPTSRVFYRFRRALMEQYAIPRHRVTPTTLLEDLFPAEGGQQLWQRLGTAMAGWRLPQRERPRWLQGLILGCVGCAIVAGFGCLALDRLFLGLSALVGYAGLAACLSRFAAPLVLEIPSDCARVRGMVVTLTRLNMARLAIEGGAVHDQEIWVTLRRLISEQLGVEEHEVTPEARFVEDLGI